MRTRSLVQLLALLCAGLMILALGPAALANPRHHAHGPHTWHVFVGGQGDHGAIQTMGFYPKHIWVDQGDTVVWRANAAEIHTVTFFEHSSPCPAGVLCAMPLGGFNPGDPLQSTRHGGHVYDGTSFYSSGVMTRARGAAAALPPFATLHRRYRLTFPDTLAPGTYVYYCLVHGKMSKGTIVVQAKGSPYPYSQKQYDRQARRQIRSSVADGNRLWARARHTAHKLTRRNPGVTVLAGTMDERAMVMRFIPDHVTIRKGHRVHFVSTSMGEPHTVTFGNPGTGCGTPPCNPEMPWNVARGSDGNLHASYPARNAGFSGSPRALNSGLLLGLPTAVTHVPNSLTMRFTKAHRYHYVCVLHAYMGMVGTVRVRPLHH